MRHVLDRAASNPHLPSSIKRRTPKGPKPTCRPWQGGYRDSGMRPREGGNEEGGKVVLLSKLMEDLLCLISKSKHWRSRLLLAPAAKLGLSPVALVRRCGYKNVTKKLWRLELLCAGDVTTERRAHWDATACARRAS
jgi:hypothetical protein